MVLVTFLSKTPQETERHDAYIATETHDGDSVFLIFLDDVVANLFGLVDTFCGGINLFQGDDAGADALVVVQVEVFAKAGNPFLRSDDKHVITSNSATTIVVSVQHVLILCQALDGSLVFGCEPELAAVVVAARSSLNADFHGLGIADLTRGGHILHWCETAESKSHTVQVLRVDVAEAVRRINVSRAVNALFLGKRNLFFVGDWARLLIGIKIKRAFKLHNIREFYIDGDGLLTLG